MHPAAAPVEVTSLPVLAPRSPDSNQGNFGRVLVVAGSRGMSGAAVLCGSAALRGGAGLVRVAVPSGILPIVAGGNPCLMTAPLPEDEAGRLAGAALPELLQLAEGQTVLAVGPGLGRSPDLTKLVSAVLAQVKAPLVLDADGLNAIAGHAERLRGRPGLVITPHPGEFARLLGVDIPTVQAQRGPLAAKFAADHGLVVLLKGHGTVVTEGRRLFRNPTGNPGMATAGSGDVLTGLIAALLGQGLAPFEAAQLGAYLHGRAGDLAREDLGGVSLIATDLVEYLPRAFRSLGGAAGPG
jgi:NAD(P)H-hydrate epimerase